MNKYKILICDDSTSEREDIQLFLKQIFLTSSDIELELKAVSFDKVNEELETNYDLLILDLYDENAEIHKDAGINILMRNEILSRIPTVVYTSTGDSLGFDEDLMKNKYTALIKKITKVHNSYENLVEFVKGFIIANPRNKGHYHIYNENDVSLDLSIRLIGFSNFTYIMYQIFEDIGKQVITVYPMTSGFSGAVLFKLKYGNLTSILKVSNDINALRTEFENAILLYKNFPSHLINHIDSKEYLALENKVIGIMIKNVDDAQTFFDLLINKSITKAKIANYLELLYLDGNSLKDHFSNKRGEKKDWSAIFDNMNERKLAMVEKSYMDLQYVVNKYYDNKVDVNDFKNLVIYKRFHNLSIEKLLNDKFRKNLILSHGDFHAKNIMVQSDRPVIIDTGLLGYKHWSLDISRLIANIVTMGLDYNTIDYYELSSIEKDIVIADSIINKNEIPFDGVNDNAIAALNWLISNIENIYSDLYTLFEFQLGLMKEFLQVAYRFDTVPPNKRALAIIVAHKCMMAANDNVVNS